MPGSFTNDFVTIDAADSATGWTKYGHNTAPAAVDDPRIQNTFCVNHVGGSSTTTRYGAVKQISANLSTSGFHIFWWKNTLVWPALNTQGLKGAGLFFTSNATTPSATASPIDANTVEWYVDGSDKTSTGGWKCYVVDPNNVKTGLGSKGSPTYTTGNKWFGTYAWLRTGQSTSGVIAYLDALRFGTGIAVTAGTSGDPVTFTDFSVYDVGTIANAFGVISFSNGVYTASGKMKIGTLAQSTPTVFQDKNSTVIFAENQTAVSFYEFPINSASATNYTDFILGTYDNNLAANGCTIKGAGQTGSVTKTSCGTTNASAVVTQSATSGLYVGMGVYGQHIPGGAVITAITTNTNFTMSANATGTGTVTVVATGIVHAVWSLTTVVSNDASYNSKFKGYSSALSEVYGMTLRQGSEMRSCSISNFGDITLNGTGSGTATVTGCTFSNQRLAEPIASDYGIILSSTESTAISELSAFTSNTFINCPKAIKISAASTSSTNYNFSTLSFYGTSGGVSVTAQAAASSNILTTCSRTSGISVGDAVIGTNIAVGTYITYVDTTNKQLYLSKAVTGAIASPGALLFVGKWAVVNTIAATSLASYAWSNRDSSVAINGTNNRLAQSFTGNGGNIASVRVMMTKTGTPTGNAVCKIYTDSSGPNTVVATSENFDVSVLDTANWAIVPFEFVGWNTTTDNNPVLTNAATYWFSIEYTGTGSNYINVGIDNSSSTGTGSRSVYTTGWSASATTPDAVYEIYTGGIARINPSATLARSNTLSISGGSTTLLSTQRNLTVTGIRSGSEIRILDNGSPANELGGVETVSVSDGITYTDGITRYQFTYTYAFSAATIINIIVVHNEYQYYSINGYTLADSDVSIPITQIKDRNWSNS